MSLINLKDFDFRLKLPKNTIENFRKKGKSWGEIYYGCKGDEKGLNVFISNACDDYDWEITADEWKELVNTLRYLEQNSYTGFIGDPKKPIISTPENESSAWFKYKQNLIEKEFTALSVNNIETASKKVVSQLDPSTEQLHPVRGMVVGNVQSGKTANMAGVISLAEDYGYNFFVVLSGTIDNLRKQTEERLISDLDNPNCNFNLITLRNLSAKSPFNERLQDLSLEEGSNKRYLYVCLKNTGRLKDLLVWINSDKSKKGLLKMVILDDEADQAGVNTANMNKDLISKINNQIKALVFGKNHQFIMSSPYKCANYIGYTATPYANFLNEANDKSLYPTNFIMTLNSPEEYIGPQQIFGIDDINQGLPIVNVIDEQECETVKNNIPISYLNIPKELKNAIYWFVCTVACFRYWKLKKPVSMLVHTSQKVPNHQQMSNLIESFIKNISNTKDFIDDIEVVWRHQTSKLNVDRFYEELPDFPDISKIKSYPNFEEIKPLIIDLINCGPNHILLNEEATKLEYGKGIHICVDNCYNNRVEENIVMRLIYPDKKDKTSLENCPAFIVIGGTTLSRGLTLEGLTTSYFLRVTILGDTLMQMGRWFGYRKGYELLPRIWLSSGAVKQFERLTLLDFDLREELHNMETLNISPKEYGPRLDAFPEFKALQVTAKNKMQKSFEIIRDFANKKGQTTLFYGDENTIESNYKEVVNYIENLGPVNKDLIHSLKNPFATSDSLLWFNQPYQQVFELLRKLKYPTQIATFGDIDETLKWFKEQKDNGYLNDFNVIVSSNSKGSENQLKLKNVLIKLPTRRKLKNLDASDNNINLKVLTTPTDRLIDLDMSNFDDEFKNTVLNSSKMTSIEKRIKFESLNTPLLILYIIDKDSGINKADTNDRVALNLKQHLAGYFIYIPYGNNGKAKSNISTNKLTVELDFDEKGDLEDEETSN